MFRGKKLVCFDLDGTLIDSVGIWNQVDATLIQELSHVQVGLSQIQQQRDQQLKAFKHSLDPYLEYCGYLRELYGFNLSKEEVKSRRYHISQHFLDHVIELKPHAETLICTLKQQGLHIALTTTTSLSNIQRYQENNQNINRKLSFEHDFSMIWTRENVENIKPHPEVYLNALKHFKLSAQDCVIIEDSLVGVEAANQAGIDVIAIYDQYSAHEIDLIKAKANYYVEDFAALLRLVS